MSPRGFGLFTGALQFTVLLVVLLSSASLAQAQVDGTARAPASGCTSTSQLPTLGDGSELGASAERRLGDRIAREIYRDSDYLNDPVLVENVDAIWQSLLAAARSRGDVSPELDEQFAWEIMPGRDLTINAFALPGGYLCLHLGRIGVVTSRDELASVLVHGLSHVTQCQISRLMSKQSAQAPWVIGAMILGALAASKSPESAGAWQLLAGACAARGLSLWAIRADTKAQVARMDYAAALDPFKAAQTLMRNGQSAAIDHVEASIIDTRARAVQLLLPAAEASP